MRSELQILKASKTVAVVGATSTPRRPGNVATKYLLDHGFNVIPVNPQEPEVHGRKTYPSLLEVPGKVDIVSVFRRSENVPPIVDEVITIGAQAIWMQEGVEHEEAAAKARAAGIDVIMNRCIHCAIRDNEAEFPVVSS